MDDLGKAVTDAASSLLGTLTEHVPSLVVALLVLLLGWIVARVMRVLAMRGLQVIEALIGRATGGPAGTDMRGSATVFGTIVFWAVLLFFITAATQILGLVTFTQGLARLIEYLPSLIAGLLIIAAGFITARFVGELAYAAAEKLVIAQRTALARLARGAVLVAAVLVGADQMGIRVTWIAILVLILVGSLLGGVTLAASLGARAYVANLIGSHYLRQTFRIGESVRVAGFEGRILDVTATSLVLETNDGRVSLPGRVFHEEAIVLIASSVDG
jgi:hypothetical protein